MELYQPPLSSAYDGCKFHEIVTDVLARSENGNVYLIGIVEVGQRNGQIEEVVNIHPGADYTVNVNGETLGIFIASEVGDIRQREVGEYALGPAGRDKQRTLRGAMNAKDDGNGGIRTPDESIPSSRGAKATMRDISAEITPFHAFEVKREVIPPALRERQIAEHSYDVAINDIASKMLQGGVDMGVISGIISPTTKKDTSRPLALTNESSDNQPSDKVSPLRALADESKTATSKSRIAFAVDPEVDLTKLTNVSDERRQRAHLERLHRIQDKIEVDCRNPPDPPASVIDNGGHLLLCIVTSTSSETNTEVAVGELGPKMGIEHFMKPIRDKRLGQSTPTLVVLAEQLPSDWHAVAEDRQVFFVCGSPISVADLTRAGFMRANAIAVGRCHAGDRRSKKVADARAILATNLIEAQFTQKNPPPVITDLAYDASVDFLPMTQTMALAMQLMRAYPLKRSGGGGPGFLELPSLGGSEHSEENAIAETTALGEVAYEEDYDNLVSPHYVQHPRFMCGMVFVTSSMTALVANALHNPCLIPLVGGLLEAPFLLLHIPFVWQGQSYADLCEWLLTHRNLLPLGIYRSSTTSPEQDLNSDGDKKPSLYYMFTAPPAYRTVLCRGDRVLVLAPTGS
jgi:hypothetical protein